MESQWVEPGILTAAGKYAGLFDDLAAATAEPSMADVRRLLTDERLRVPDEVFNVQHRRKEAILT